MLVHGLTNKPSNNSPSDKELEFIKNLRINIQLLV